MIYGSLFMYFEPKNVIKTANILAKKRKNIIK